MGDHEKIDHKDLVIFFSPILFKFKLAVANDFINALEIKTTRMRREYCWEDAYAKTHFV